MRDGRDKRANGTFLPSDIPFLLVGLHKAMEYVYTTPLPGQNREVPEYGEGEQNGEIAF